MTASQMEPLHEIAALDHVLNDWRSALGADYGAYRNHCCRVINLCRLFSCVEADDHEKIVLAAAFHDLGIWAFGTFDYLEGSMRLARRYLNDNERADWAPEIEAMIGHHHKMTPYRAEHQRLTEVFRKADWIDVSLGFLRFELPRDDVSRVLTAFPNAGFHRTLAALTFRRLLRHPLNPLPMMKY
jgi:hypothetical protein